jgi:hypothetical protein
MHACAGGPSSGDRFDAAPNIDHAQPFVKRDIAEWMQWLRAQVGFDGWRCAHAHPLACLSRQHLLYLLSKAPLGLLFFAIFDSWTQWHLICAYPTC